MGKKAVGKAETGAFPVHCVLCPKSNVLCLVSCYRIEVGSCAMGIPTGEARSWNIRMGQHCRIAKCLKIHSCIRG